MNRKNAFSLSVLAVLLAVMMAGGTALAQTSPSYDLEWHVIGGGGQPVSSAHYAVNSTAGQGAASPPFSSSAHYVISGGYWFRPSYAVHLPLVLRDHP
jgi:hypothetical protein